jgi:hypothetical protein
MVQGRGRREGERTGRGWIWQRRFGGAKMAGGRWCEAGEGGRHARGPERCEPLSPKKSISRFGADAGSKADGDSPNHAYGL